MQNFLKSTPRTHREADLPKFMKRPLSRNLNFAAATAKLHGVTVEHLLDTIAKRKALRMARMYRRRAAERSVLKKGQHRYELQPGRLKAGEGELDGLLLACNISKEQACEIFGVNISAFNRWYGFPLHPWPCRFLRLYGWALNARKWMEDNGLDPELFTMKPVTEYKNAGRYPRKASDIEVQT